MKKKLFSSLMAIVGVTLVVMLSACSKDSADKNLTFTVNGVTFKMIYVQNGTFQMGTNDMEADDDIETTPVHQVTLTKNYYVGETEVTQALWNAVMGSDNNPSRYKGDQLPVESVSYDDIVGENGFIAKLNKATGKTFRLPTEAEWEFAARGGNKSKNSLFSGSTNHDEVAWSNLNSEKTTHAVATKKANELGIYDMSGNVREWCADWYEKYSSAAQTDPVGPTTGGSRINRGGCLDYDWQMSCVMCRDYDTPSYTSKGLGFRLCLSEE